jgi:hypothetical protein
MANIEQGAAAVVGAVVGFIYGGPYGAVYGFQIGLLLGTALFPLQLPTVYGPRLADLQSTSAQLGGPIPIIYGTIAVPGSVIFLSCVEEVATTEEVGGKGAPEQSVTSYAYYQSIALGLCEGEISGLLRVWENGELKYDNRPQQDDETDEQYNTRLDASSDYAATFSLYLGDEAQEADPTIELTMGVGSVPAFRGLAYIVYPNRQLTDDQGRRHPAFRFEVFRGTGERDVVFPTNLPTLNGWQGTTILPDWVRGRYIAFDESSAPNGIRAYSILDNTEYAARTFEDIGISVGLTAAQPTIGLDGFLYWANFVTGSAVKVYRIDPTTLELVKEAAGATSDIWTSAVTLRVTGAGRTEDYLFSAPLLVGNFHVRRCESLALVSTYSNPRSRAVTVTGPTAGAHAYAYALAYNPVGIGSGPSVIVVKLDAHIPPPTPRYTVTTMTFSTLAEIAPSAIVPAWVAIEEIRGLVFDATDNTLIFGAIGHESGFTNRETYLVKWNPEAGVLVWKTAGLSLPLFDTNNELSRLRSGKYAVPCVIEKIQVYDTATGAVDLQDWSAELPNSATAGTWVYDSQLDALIVFISSFGPTVIFLDRQTPAGVSLAEIVNDVCERCGLGAEEYETTELESRVVNGYALASIMPGRSAIEPLRSVGFFDAVESEGVIRFRVRGGPVVATLTTSDLGARNGGEQPSPAVATKKLQDVELPRQLRVRYMAESREYEPGEQLSPTRFTTDGVNDRDVELAVSLSDDMAAQIAEVLWADAWASRWAHQIALDVSFLALDPADVLELPVDGRLYRVRVVSIDDSGGVLRRIELVRDDDGSYTSTAVADVPQLPVPQLVLYSATTLVLLDLPPLRDEDDDAGIYAAAYRATPGRSWNGTVIQRSIDEGASFSTIATIVNEATVGRLAEALPAGISSTWDYANEIVVELLAGTLESRTEDAVIQGANALAIGVDGRWEIVQFLNATQTSETLWTLSGLLRGRRATEHNIGTAEAGDTVVLISGAGIVRLPLQSSEIDAERVYRAVTLGTLASTGMLQTFVGSGEALEPFSPVHIHGARAANGDLTITWARRGRIGQELRDGADMALSEETESYEVDILDPGSPGGARRTLASSTTSVAYTAAQQIADGFSLGQLIPVEVYQLSATVGRGTQGSATI